MRCAGLTRICAQRFAPWSRSFCATPLCLKLVPFKLADIGEGILKVEVLQVFVKEGDHVAEFDRLCEVQSDKATVEITSKVSGVIQRLHVVKGATALVGSVIAEIETEGGSATTTTANSPQAAVAAVPSPASAATAGVARDSDSVASQPQGKVLATPATRRIAMENHVDLTKVVATGKGNRVMKEDVLRYLEEKQQRQQQHPLGGDRPTATSAAATVPPSSSAVAVGASDRVVPITGIRKAMVKSMTEANSIPTFGASDEIEVSKLILVRESLKSVVQSRENGLKLSFLPFFLKAASLALLQYPELNAYTNADCTELLVKASHNIGFAMDTPSGLLVPNIKDVQTKSVLDLAKELSMLMEKGKKGAFRPSDLQSGTFTLSNIGSIGATYAHPVIFPPQVAIGAIGRMRRLPRFDEKGNVIPANIINTSWSADHRVVDGATMVRFNNLFKDYLENPSLMLLDTK